MTLLHPHGCVRALIFDKGLPGFYPSIKTFAAIIASFLMGFRRLFGLIVWSFRLHGKNLAARAVDADFFIYCRLLRPTKFSLFC
jgi:hypothetical protein